MDDWTCDEVIGGGSVQASPPPTTSHIEIHEYPSPWPHEKRYDPHEVFQIHVEPLGAAAAQDDEDNSRSLCRSEVDVSVTTIKKNTRTILSFLQQQQQSSPRRTRQLTFDDYDYPKKKPRPMLFQYTFGYASSSFSKSRTHSISSAYTANEAECSRAI